MNDIEKMSNGTRVTGTRDEDGGVLWRFHPGATPWPEPPVQVVPVGRRRTILANPATPLAQRLVDRHLTLERATEANTEYQSWSMTGDGHAMPGVGQVTWPYPAEALDEAAQAIIADAVKHACRKCGKVFPRGGRHLHEKHCKFEIAK